MSNKQFKCPECGGTDFTETGSSCTVNTYYRSYPDGRIISEGMDAESWGGYVVTCDECECEISEEDGFYYGGSRKQVDLDEAIKLVEAGKIKEAVTKLKSIRIYND